jgi:hypothetical protein
MAMDFMCLHAHLIATPSLVSCLTSFALILAPEETPETLKEIISSNFLKMAEEGES